ncbi:hypothetical protein SmJEL517_g02790 [Synchytrium microbalum]|uniref:DNA 5'-3' helicase n=1 Tax=Synchytrium microbalum TaxID=1806994 RepID=A0A507C624_9FUNG|nr:uncharacterized protein SmJEL517_g02790 [Synchytrium microbalum]TPX34559.1 hypothetical protein SmJEL517_g02790 [Synchytrium microbalum]
MDKKRPVPKSFTNKNSKKKKTAVENVKQKRISDVFSFKGDGSEPDIPQPIGIPKPVENVPRLISELVVRGVPVAYPFKPYPSQVAMTAKIISALQLSQNALLESPTGTGKTLALLVSVLAWREADKTRQIQEWNALHAKMEQESIEAEAAAGPSSPLKKDNQPPKRREPIQIAMDDDDDNDFVTQKPRKVPQHENVVDPLPPLPVIKAVAPKNQEPLKLKLPKIYFTSRTQKQLQQVIKELKNNVTYRPKMAILGSREHMCINPTVKRAENKNEKCDEVVTSDSCKFFHGVRNLRANPVLSSGIWDIEDIVSIGTRRTGCPYFTARAFAETADIVFAPYNYLINPLIRQALEIDLEGAIVIIDEAHNTEDAAADSGSVELTEDALKTAEDDLTELSTSGHLHEEYAKLLHVVQSFRNWLAGSDQIDFNVTDFDRSLKIHSGREAVKIFERIGLIKGSELALKEALQRIMSEQRRELDILTLSTFVAQSIRALIMVMGYLFSEDSVDDFKMVICKKPYRHASTPSRTVQYSVGFWCLNPAVIFQEITNSARSVILTSGTLSPLNSFASELGGVFDQRLEATHVIANDSVWVGVVPSGPNGKAIHGVYKNLDCFEYQDEVGQSLLNFMSLIPEGMLAFLPSYSALDKLMNRWKSTGVLKEMEKLKKVFTEPKATGRGEFEQVMQSYENSIQAGHGGFILCVYRGKMSEGIDFSDSKARAVIAIGIPYPNTKDIKIQQKRLYNDQKSKVKNLLTGGEWYEIQAWRAVNQALGRCIRHRNDWGAIILLDQRFTNNKARESLSKWIRTKSTIRNDFASSEQSLREFFQRRTAPPLQVKHEQLAVDSTIIHMEMPPQNMDIGPRQNMWLPEADTTIVKMEMLQKMEIEPRQNILLAKSNHVVVSDQIEDTTTPNQNTLTRRISDHPATASSENSPIVALKKLFAEGQNEIAGRSLSNMNAHQPLISDSSSHALMANQPVDDSPLPVHCIQCNASLGVAVGLTTNEAAKLGMQFLLDRTGPIMKVNGPKLGLTNSTIKHTVVEDGMLLMVAVCACGERVGIQVAGVTTLDVPSRLGALYVVVPDQMETAPPPPLPPSPNSPKRIHKEFSFSQFDDIVVDGY